MNKQQLVNKLENLAEMEVNGHGDYQRFIRVFAEEYMTLYGVDKYIQEFLLDYEEYRENRKV